ncbi:hypothetical protein AX774_g602 [Zancudomyces culisetae]|uniref:Uncharacterized protein n=1 Tax=Zancudomyces culisetae TaxID=1213189 RepID=A0A1R1PY20_ZANCU|nr:hypothetical protein AX774_g602 [Zancudomyces culisetae]|eukprot:OMH85843.1 hypothetical protein AX774_g602 [Zancudomyces culisetae]
MKIMRDTDKVMVLAAGKEVEGILNEVDIFEIKKQLVELIQENERKEAEKLNHRLEQTQTQIHNGSKCIDGDSGVEKNGTRFEQAQDATIKRVTRSSTQSQIYSPEITGSYLRKNMYENDRNLGGSISELYRECYNFVFDDPPEMLEELYSALNKAIIDGVWGGLGKG